MYTPKELHRIVRDVVERITGREFISYNNRGQKFRTIKLHDVVLSDSEFNAVDKELQRQLGNQYITMRRMTSHSWRNHYDSNGGRYSYVVRKPKIVVRLQLS